MRKNKLMYWTYNIQHPRREYNDPRLIVARHIGWQKIFGEQSQFCVPEPDNYNRAILTKQPVDCQIVEDQVIYKDVSKGQWITLMYVPDEQLAEYDLWLSRQEVIAYWLHKSAPRIRYRKEPAA